MSRGEESAVMPVVAEPPGRAPKIRGFVVPFRWSIGALCQRTGPFLFDEPAYVGRDTGEPFEFKAALYRAAAERRRMARQVCQVCPVLQDCATHAMTFHEPHGVWAGTSPRQRLQIVAAAGAQVADRVAQVLAVVGVPTTPEGITWSQFVGSRVRRANRKAALLLAEETALLSRQSGDAREVERGEALKRAVKVHGAFRAS